MQYGLSRMLIIAPSFVIGVITAKRRSMQTVHQYIHTLYKFCIIVLVHFYCKRFRYVTNLTLPLPANCLTLTLVASLKVSSYSALFAVRCADVTGHVKVELEYDNAPHSETPETQALLFSNLPLRPWTRCRSMN